ncbi:uncharacterized protein LOC116852603 [Odontomachus brunneus]|uniref:uncharacterized protein LOC116852603 n=1 Tax=Odontomachus brunneus TaxID=486640 RepID=UPI0013F1D841|nr:uncharacterized protein LOC116852603 [Odontomachus brunneus]
MSCPIELKPDTLAGPGSPTVTLALEEEPVPTKMQRETNKPDRAVCQVSAGLAPRQPEEDQRLQQFLEKELAAFDETIIDHDQKVAKIEHEGVIEPSCNTWCSSVAVVKKTIPLDEANKLLTAFTVPGRGLMQFTVMPFGLHSAPATFQRLIDTVFGPELEPHVFIYLDDIIIVSETSNDHHTRLQDVFQRLRRAKLRINPEKCRFCTPQLKYLGHVIDREGAILTQHLEDGECVISYASRRLNPAERNYSATELEGLAVLWGIRHLRRYLEGYTFTLLTDHQSLQWLRRLESPTGRLARWLFELQQFDFKAVRRQPADHPDYLFRNGRLWHHRLYDLYFCDTPYNTQWKQYVPWEDQERVMRENHDAPTAKHLGVAKTISRVAQTYFWPGMQRSIARPWEQVSVDFVGSLPQSRNDHTSLLVLQDRFTKYMELQHLQKATTTAIQQHLTTGFCSEKFRALFRSFNIEHHTSPVYTPHYNPVERANRTIKTIIRQFVGKNNRHWDEQLLELQFAFNKARKDSTGYTPAFLTHGRELRAPTTPLPPTGGSLPTPKG